MRSPAIISSFILTSLLVSLNFARAQAPLRKAFEGSFLVGVALNEAQFEERNSAEAALIKAQFNSITPENVMKWEAIHPWPDRYNFATADRYVDFGTKNGMFIIGHTLVWHSQTPAWVFQDALGHPADRATLLARMRDHIHSIVTRYKGRVKGWDVVNEVMGEDGSLRNSPWRSIIGDDYIAQAFQFAHEADPAAELYYNDYGLENETKRKGALELVRRLKQQGVPITGVGLQEHVSLNWPAPAAVEETIDAFAGTGVKVMITELDVNVLPEHAGRIAGDADVGTTGKAEPTLDPYPKALPAEVQQALARRYATLFRIYEKHRGAITRVTFWGATDADSWLNNWPVKGRTNYPLLFDRSCRPKPAFDAVLAVSKE